MVCFYYGINILMWLFKTTLTTIYILMFCMTPQFCGGGVITGHDRISVFIEAHRLMANIYQFLLLLFVGGFAWISHVDWSFHLIWIRRKWIENPLPLPENPGSEGRSYLSCFLLYMLLIHSLIHPSFCFMMHFTKLNH